MRSNVLDLVSWAQLSRLGNSPIAKAIIFAPVVAIMVQLNESWLASKLGLESPIWLYWSLILIAAAQALYTLGVPRPIKLYGAEKERFVVEALSSWDVKNFTSLGIDRTRSFYDPKNGEFLLPETVWQANDHSALKVALEGAGWKISSVNNGDAYLGDLFTLFNFLRGKSDNLVMTATRCHAARLLSRVDSGLISPRDKHGDLEEISSDAHGFFLGLSKSPQDEGWRVAALNWRYSSENVSRQVIRIVTAAFYTFGLVYFVWQAIDSFFWMLLLSMSK